MKCFKCKKEIGFWSILFPNKYFTTYIEHGGLETYSKVICTKCRKNERYGLSCKIVSDGWETYKVEVKE